MKLGIFTDYLSSPGTAVGVLLHLTPETALAEGSDNLLITNFSGCFSIPVLLEFSAGSDIVDHSRLLETLSSLGFHDNTLSLFLTHLYDDFSFPVSLIRARESTTLEMLGSWRLDIVKMSVLSKLMYKFNAFLIKIPPGFCNGT